MESPGQETLAPESQEVAGFLKFVNSPPKLTVLTDHALASEQAAAVFAHDPFNFRYKLGPVYDILRHADPDGSSGSCRTPMAILISGGWGTGKTSAMRWLAGLLKKWDEDLHEGSVPSGVTVYPVWFNPWKYDGKEEVWRGLISEIIIESTTKGSGWERAVEATKRFGLFLGKSFLHALASVKCRAKLASPGAGGEVELDLACVKEILAEYKGAAHPEKAYLNEFENTLRDWLRKTIQKNERMVVFVDDLDRCLPEVALEVLEALKLYLDIPGLIFVVGMDKSIVERIIVEHYRGLGLVRAREQEQTGEEVDYGQYEETDEEKAKKYLSKMFQIEVEVGPTQRQIQEFLDEQLASIPYWVEHLSPENRELFSRIVLNLAACNPREIKRFLNSGLMVGVGSEMMRPEPEENGLCFAQGLQSFFIRRIVYKRWEDAATRMDEDNFRSFLSDWSQFALAHPDFCRDEGTRDSRWKQADQEFGRKRGYRKYTRLLRDDNLWSLMRIPFSPELAELTSRVVSPFEPLTRSTAPRGGEKGPTEHMLSDRIIIDQRIARQINKPSPDISPAECEQLTQLDLSYSEIRTLESIDRLKKLESLALFNCVQLQDITSLAALTRLRELDLRETTIDNLKSLAELAQMRELYLRDARVEDLTPLASLTRLQRVDLIGLPVTDVRPLANLRELQHLDLTETQISDIAPLQNLSRLQTLYLCGTRVVSIAPLGNLTDLKYLDLGDLEGISDVTPLALLTGLQHLDLCNTRVSRLEPLADLAGLRTLYLEVTPVKDLTPLRNLRGLQKLRLAVTQITDVTPLGHLTSLQELRLATTSVSTVKPLRNLTNLRVLYLEGTQVADIRPLAALHNLQELHLADMPVTDFTPLRNLRSLRQLNLRSTAITDLAPIHHLPDLRRLDITGTNVPAEEIENLKRTLPQLRVYT